MGAAAIIAFLWLAFAATHIALSSVRLRPRLVAALGDRPFQGLYSAVALGLFVPLVWIYFGNKHAGPSLWYLGDEPAVQWFGILGMGIAFVLAVGGLLQPSPASIAPGRAKVAGVLRITRHPLFMGLGLFGLLHLVTANLYASDLAFFGGFPLFALIGCHHQDQRKRRTASEELRRFYAETPFLPFSRRGGLRGLAEMPVALALGIALTAVIRTFHDSLFG
ncbi:MAG: NnrU family protein [Myxococcales bacterium]|nr:NnrU family protein [Myxococcales bacterium]